MKSMGEFDCVIPFLNIVEANPAAKVGRMARLPWAHSTRLQQLSPLLLTTNNSNKSGHLLFA